MHVGNDEDTEENNEISRTVITTTNDRHVMPNVRYSSLCGGESSKHGKYGATSSELGQTKTPLYLSNLRHLLWPLIHKRKKKTNKYFHKQFKTNDKRSSNPSVFQFKYCSNIKLIDANRKRKIENNVDLVVHARVDDRRRLHFTIN